MTTGQAIPHRQKNSPPPAPTNANAPGPNPGRNAQEVNSVTSDEVFLDVLAGVLLALEPARHPPTA
jgi:hypothetical protein